MATTPKNLNAAAARFWRETIEAYELSPSELRILEDACREMVLIDRMEAEQAGGDLIGRGSMGQPVAAPLLAELRMHRTTLNTLLKGLGLDAEGGADGAASQSARDLAMKRWAQRGA